MIDKIELLHYLGDEYKFTIWQIMAVCGCSKNTVINSLKKYEIPTPKGFFSTGKKVGRPTGIPMSEELKKELSENFSGENNPMYGKEHSDEAKEKMSKNHADVSGEKNPFKISLADPEKLAEHKERCLRIWEERPSDDRKAISKKISKSLSEGTATQNIKFHRNHKAGRIDTTKAGTVFFRSSWEEFVCRSLDKNPLVESFDLEPFAIPYLNKDDEERYVKIDFFVTLTNGEKLMLEVKPLNLCGYKNNPYKIVGYKKHCSENGIQFTLVTETTIDREIFGALIDDAYDGNLYLRGNKWTLQVLI